MRRLILLGLLALGGGVAHADLCTAELEVITMPLPNGQTLDVWGQLGVFTPATAESQLYGFRLLETAMAQDLSRAKRILIIGAGGGFEAVALARHSSARIEALDVDPAAVALTRLNIRRHGLEARIRVLESDLFAAARGRYDLILFNAPRPIDKEWILASLGATQGELVWRDKILRSPDRFDPNGRLLKRCLRQSVHHLRRGGTFLLMSDENITRYLPRTLTDEVGVVEPWCEDAREGRFAIHLLRSARP